MGASSHVGNHALPINKLPSELLIEIFSFLNDRVQQTEGRVWDYTQRFDIARFMKVMLVCRHWRSLSLTTPKLWRNLYIGLNREWAELFLARSAHCTIDVTFGLPSFQESFNLVVAHAHRLRRIYVEYAHYDQLPDLADLLKCDMPALETINTVHGWLDDCTSDRPVLLCQVTSKLQIPRLHSLTLHRVKTPCDVEMYTRLRTLDLDCCLSPFSSLDLFLDVLSVSTALEDLRLNAFLSSISEGWSEETIPHRSPVPLPHLKRLRLSGNSSARTRRFLAHVSLPPTIDLDVAADCGTSGAEISLAILPPNAADVLPILQSVTRVQLVEYVSITVSAQVSQSDSSSRAGGGTVTTALHFGPGFWLEHPLPICLHQLACTFQHSPITHLDVFGIGHRDAESAEWETVFRTFTQLEVLTVSGSGCPTGVFAGLGNASVCPSLRNVKVHDGVEASKELFRAILDCMRRRAADSEDGVGLVRLDLTLEHESGARYRALRRSYLSQLEEYVSFVFYEDAAVSDAEWGGKR